MAQIVPRPKPVGTNVFGNPVWSPRALRLYRQIHRAGALEVANAAGFYPSTVSIIEDGKRASAHKIARIEKFLNGVDSVAIQVEARHEAMLVEYAQLIEQQENSARSSTTASTPGGADGAYQNTVGHSTARKAADQAAR